MKRACAWPLQAFLGFFAVNLKMRCVYCTKRAGFLRRVCTPCAKVVAIVERAGGEVGLAGLVDIFVEEGVDWEQVGVVLDAQIGAGPSNRHRLSSNMIHILIGTHRMPA